MTTHSSKILHYPPLPPPIPLTRGRSLPYSRVQRTLHATLGTPHGGFARAFYAMSCLVAMVRMITAICEIGTKVHPTRTPLATCQLLLLFFKASFMMVKRLRRPLWRTRGIRGVRSSGPASSRMCRSSGVRINVRDFCFRSFFFFMFVFVLSVAVFYQ